MLRNNFLTIIMFHSSQIVKRRKKKSLINFIERRTKSRLKYRNQR